jgi:hypothetical protein
LAFVEVTATEIRLTVDGLTETLPLTITPAVITGGTERLEFGGNRYRLDDVIYYA